MGALLTRTASERSTSALERVKREAGLRAGWGTSGSVTQLLAAASAHSPGRHSSPTPSIS